MSVLIIVWDSNFDSIHIWLYTSNFPDRFFKVNLFYIKSWSDPVYYDLYCSKAILKQNVSIRNCYAEMFSLMFFLPICVACIISQNYRNNLSFPQRKKIIQPPPFGRLWMLSVDPGQGLGFLRGGERFFSTMFIFFIKFNNFIIFITTSHGNYLMRIIFFII